MKGPENVQSDFRPAFVVPRYGEEIVGGAENLARKIAEQLASRGHQVTALTTQALSHYTWENHYPEGTSVLNGVEVIRFPAQTRLGEISLHEAVARINAGDEVDTRTQERWLKGIIYSRQLTRYIKKHGKQFSHLVFLPYLFGTTYFGSSIHPERSYIIPCLHDEPFAHQPVIIDMLKSVKGLMFNSPGEKRLAARLLEKEDPGPVVGMGFEPYPHNPSAFRDRTYIRGDFVLYAGRREEGKNTPLLIDFFRRYRIRGSSRVSLVLMGAGEVSIPPDSTSFIYDLGRVSEQNKWDGYASAYVFCQPSVNESLSIVLMESWLAGRPALVNRECDVTSDHVKRSGGGLLFSGYPQFAEALDMMFEDRGRARAMGQLGRQYVEREYNWDSVMSNFYQALGVGR